MTKFKITFLFLSVAILSACEECPTSTQTGSGTNSAARAPASTTPTSTSTAKQCPPPETPPPEPPAPPPPPPPPPEEKIHPLLWESARSGTKPWTTHTLKVIKDEVASSLMPGASDVTLFCPRYDTLTNHERANFWGLLISAMVRYESNFVPTTRYKESTMGTDPVTKQHVHSEGLLQLSYQDTQWATYCEFDWSKDKNLAPNDPKKTIFDPYKNLSCGIKILARQITRRNKIAVTFKEGAYWAVLIPGGKYSKVNEISALTKKMPGCM